MKRKRLEPQCPKCGRYIGQWIKTRNIWNCSYCHILYYGEDQDINGLDEYLPSHEKTKTDDR